MKNQEESSFYKEKRVLKITWYILLTSTILLVLSLCILCFLVIVCKFLKKKERTDGKDADILQFYSFNPHTNTSSVGFVSMMRELEYVDYESYVEESGTRVLISKFGTKEYECTGICYCSTETGRRGFLGPTTVTVIKYYIAIGAAAIIGKVAYDYFFNTCNEEMSGTCPPEDIVAEPSECEPLKDEVFGVERDNFEGMNDPIEEEVKEEKKLKHSSGSFDCTGKCLTRKNFDDEEYPSVFEEEAGRYGCSILDMTQSFDSSLVVEHYENTKGQSFTMKVEEATDIAAVVFTDQFLAPFCEMNSLLMVEVKTVPMCVGSTKKNKRNPSVHCIWAS